MAAEKAKLVQESDSDNELEDDKYGEETFGLCLEKLNLGPKKKLLVLGLGGFLCYRFFRYDEPNVPTSRAHDEIYGNYLIYKRSYCDEFIKFCLERFEVAVWSSSTRYNTTKTLECLVKYLKRKLLFVWGQEECTDTGFGSIEKEAKPLFVKELNKVWEDIDCVFDDKFSSTNTLLIDDKPYKSLLNPVHNAIFPEPYQVDDEDEALGPKSELRSYLDKLVDAYDVPSFVKANPFGQMAITPRHCDWSYYSKVIDSFEIGVTCGSDKDI